MIDKIFNLIEKAITTAVVLFSILVASIIDVTSLDHYLFNTELSSLHYLGVSIGTWLGLKIIQKLSTHSDGCIDDFDLFD